MRKVELEENEYYFLCNAPFLKQKHQNGFLSNVTQVGGKYLLKIGDDDAEEIRELCGEQLQLSGFNINYELTSDGKALEALIDKFFIG